MSDPAPSTSRERVLGDITLAYRSRRPTPKRLLLALTSAAQALDEQHDWWAEGIGNFLVQSDNSLEGATRLSLIGYEAADGEPVELDDDVDAFMAWMDLCVIVDWLADRSAEHNVDWDVSYAGEPVGRIVAGEPDEALEAFVCALGEAVGATFEEADDERATVISEEHRDRLTCSERTPIQ